MAVLDKRLKNAQKVIKEAEGSGPIITHIHKVLQDLGVDIQPYFGKSFVGNHANKYYKPENINAMCDAIKESVLDVCIGFEIDFEDASEILSMCDSTAKKIQGNKHEKFKEINLKYSKVNESIIHIHPLDDASIDQIDLDIKDFMKAFRTHYPGKIIPKMHFLEDHVVDWMRKWEFGLGFHGEQAVESSHSVMNNILNDRRGIRNRATKVWGAMRSHYLRGNLRIRSRVPETKRRKRKSLKTTI